MVGRRVLPVRQSKNRRTDGAIALSWTLHLHVRRRPSSWLLDAIPLCADSPAHIALGSEIISFPTPSRSEAGRATALATAIAPAFGIGSMLSFQIGTALSVPLLLAVGPSSTTWLRLVGAATLLWAVTKPALAAYSGRTFAAAGFLGVATCGMAVLYAEAIARIPLGMATAIEFAGPLTVAIAASRGLLDISWAALAGLGVALLTLTTAGWSADTLGIAFAFAAAVCWAAYIVLTKRVGQAFQGLQGLTVSLTVAALVATPYGISQLRVGAHAWEIAASLALGVLIPVLPYGLEMLALRRMSTRAFGILMSADPAISSLVGWFILQQTLGAQKVIGVACVVFASIGATLGRRP